MIVIFSFSCHVHLRLSQTYYSPWSKKQTFVKKLNCELVLCPSHYHEKIFGSGKVRLYWLEPPFALVGVGMNTEFIVVRISRLVPWKRPVRRHIRQQRRRLVVLWRTLAANGAPAQPAGHKQDDYQCTVS